MTETVEVTMKTLTNPRFVAVMKIHGFPVLQVKRGRHASQVAFEIPVPKAREAEFDRLMALCEDDLSVPLPGGDGPSLGDYEKALGKTFQEIKDYNEENGNERG